MKSRSRGLQRIERLLWATVLLTLGIYAGARAVSVLGQSYGEWSFARSAGGQQVSATLFVRYLLGEPEAQPAPPDLPQTAPGLQPLPATSWMARLEIPRLRYSVMVREGTDQVTLGIGVGHITGTSLPGRDDGNVGLAGHRDTFFRKLSQVKVGDALRLQTLTEDFSYTVTRIKIVEPSENHVLAYTEQPSLTLVTCYPFWGLGPAPRRYIIQAVIRP
jgi:LPXTG-site transpeptidase (sortase) family protein